MENGVKLEPEARHDRVDFRLEDRFDHEASDHDDGEGSGPARRTDGHSASPELMNMLRPKVELNDVPELDTSMGEQGAQPIPCKQLVRSATYSAYLQFHLDCP